MNHKTTKHTLFSLLAALLLFSCSQEELPGVDSAEEDSEILFFTSMPGVQARSDDHIDGESIKKGFYVSAASLDSLEANGRPTIRFKQEMVTHTEGMGDAFRSDNCRWPSNKGNKDGKLRFFAYYPSFKTLRDSAGLTDNDKGYFVLEYNTTGSKHEYWIKKFKVNEDIARHSDFVTAIVDGSKTENLYSGVQLTLQHQLSRIDVRAFGASESYDVEIAGVRVGGIATEGDFNFEGTGHPAWCNTQVGKFTGTIKKGCTEYVYRKGDTVITIGKGSHDTETAAVSIMGEGGRAMVIPMNYTRWLYKNNVNNNNQHLYFSVLLRVKEKLTDDKKLIYPYIEKSDITSSIKTDKMNVVYLSIERSTGKVVTRVYRKLIDGHSKYFTDEGCTKEYATPTTEEIRNYGWASVVPYSGGDSNQTYHLWNPGCDYIYRLDYTNGIGIQDPADALPGKPIISPIEVTGTEKPWHTVDPYKEEEIIGEDVNFRIE
ncbi:MAG: fimbrillin family protein [Muribaculaceae bacterium]|nr:fimbrillin family protein [Muribaculaceae bacterium]